MQGFVKTTATNVKQILFCTDPQVSVGIIVDDAGVEADTEGKKIVKAGTPLGGSLTNRDVPFEKARAASVEVNESITTVDAGGITIYDLDRFNEVVNGVSGTYTFQYEDADKTWWEYPNSRFALGKDHCGIAYIDGGEQGDKIGLDFTGKISPAGVLLHDVDVTAGDDNGTLLIFGFVDLAKVDESVVPELVAAQSALDGKVYLCK